MKKISKVLSSLGKKISPLVLSALILTPQIVKSESSFFWKAGLRYEDPIVNSVSNIPLVIRDVPIHPNDSWVPEKNIAPINDTTVEGFSRLGFRGTVGVKKLFYKDVRGSIGFNLDIFIDDGAPLNRIAERNYMGDPGTRKRGYGTALTYYLVSSANGPILDFVRPSIYSELEFILKPFGVAFGYELFRERIVMKNGWDRYDRLDTKDTYDLVKTIMGCPRLSLRIYDSKYNFNISFDIGKHHILSKETTDLGKQTEIDFSKSLLFGSITGGLNF